MRQIEIDMLDMYRSLGAGRRIVTYLGFQKGQLLCEDTLGTRVRVPRSKFRFVGVLGHTTHVTEDGHIRIKVDGEWKDLGPLFSDGHP